MGPEQMVLRWQQGPEEGQAGHERDPWEPPVSSAQPRHSSHFTLQGSPPPHSRTTAWPCPLGRAVWARSGASLCPPLAWHHHPQLCSRLSLGCTTV